MNLNSKFCVWCDSPPVGQGLLIHNALQITHDDAPQSVGLRWTSDQLVAETSDNTQHSQETDIHASVGFEPTISGERPQTHALDREATVTGIYIKLNRKNRTYCATLMPSVRLSTLLRVWCCECGLLPSTGTIFNKTNTEEVSAGGKVCQSYSECAQFDSRPGYRRTWKVYRCFLQSEDSKFRKNKEYKMLDHRPTSTAFPVTYRSFAHWTLHNPNYQLADKLNRLWRWTLLQKLRVPQLVKKFLAFYITQRFITVFTRPG
jgi:hypothetical protein